MKRNILHTFWAAALLLTACTQEEILLPDADDAEPLSITVTDGGYASTDKTATRATENGYTTQFTAGDICGLYVVRNGTIVYDNVKLTATTGTNGSLSWQPGAGVTLAGGFTGERYFLYYPYQADMTGKVTASATNDADFFAPLISGWQPKTDQSDYATGYTASDLMTATGSAVKTDGKLSLSFAMTHRMALAVIDCPPKTIVYHFTNTTGGNIPDYTVRLSPYIDITSEAKPWHATDGSYRYIVCPMQKNATPLTGYYDGCIEDFTIPLDDLVKGCHKTYRLTGLETIEKSHNLQVGDYLLVDGSLVSKDETLSPEQKASVSAIVFWSPAETDYTNRQNPASLTDDKIMATDYPNCNHGLAVAVKTMSSKWQNNPNKTQTVSMWQNKSFTHDNKGNFVPVNTFSFSNSKIYGYQNTVVLRAYNSNNSSYTVQLVSNLISFSKTYPAPVGSTGWFIPSVKETYMLCNKDVDDFSTQVGFTTRDIVNASLNQIDEASLGATDYWTSTEYQVSTARKVSFTNAAVSSTTKTTSANVIAVCAF